MSDPEPSPPTRYFFTGLQTRSHILSLAGVSALIVVFLSLIKFNQYQFDQAGLLSNRIQWWQGALKMFSNNIFNGVGWGNFGNYYPVYKTGPGLNTIFAHNLPLQMLGETGIFGTLLFAAIVISAIVGFAGKFNTRPASKYFFAPVFLSVLSFISLNVLDYSFYIPALSMIFWILLSSFDDRPLAPRGKTLSNNPVVYFIFIIMSLLVLLPLKSAVHLNAAQRLLRLNQYDKAEAEAWKAVSSDPLGRRIGQAGRDRFLEIRGYKGCRLSFKGDRMPVGSPAKITRKLSLSQRPRLAVLDGKRPAQSDRRDEKGAGK